MYTPTLFSGNKIRLTTLEEPDLQVIAKWHEDEQFTRFYDADPAFPRNKNQMKDLLEASPEKNDFLFAVRTLDDQELVGVVRIDGLLWAHGTAWITMGIGGESNRSKGYGREALHLALGYAFRELNLHRVQLTVFSYNTRAIATYEKAGFTLEGTYREFLQRDGKRHDMLLYGILRHEWEQGTNAFA